MKYRRAPFVPCQCERCTEHERPCKRYADAEQPGIAGKLRGGRLACERCRRAEWREAQR